MNFPQRLKFVLWFAAHDLAGDRRSRRLALVHLVTVTAVVLVAVLVVGLGLGSIHLQESRMSKDRRATYLRLTPRSEKALNAEQVTRLREAFLARLPARAGVQAFPYRILEWDWHDRQEPQYRWRFRGRTLAANDPLLETEPRLGGRTFQQPDENGVMVTEAMLRELHGSVDKSADPLQVTLKIRPERIPLLGVLTQPLPGGLDFVVTETSANELLRRNPNPQASEILTGPLPLVWKDLDPLPEAATKEFPETHFEWVGSRRHGLGWVWKFVALKQPFPRLTDWQIKLEKLRAILSPNVNIAPNFHLLEPVRIVEEPREVVDSKYTHVGVHLGGWSDLDTTLDATLEIAEEQGLEANADVVAQLRALLRAGNRASKALFFLVFILMVLALGNLYVLYDLRAQQKITEIGMLKAMGMSQSLLGWIYLAEVLLVWLLGAGIGLLVGWQGGIVLVRSWIVDHPEEAAAAFYCPWTWMVGILLGSGVMSLVSIWIATRKARRASALKSLAGG